MTKFYADGAGRYLGGFDGAAAPAGSIEVPLAPAAAWQVWNGAAWAAVPAVAVVPARIPMLNAHLVLIEAGWMDGINTYINALPEPMRSRAVAYFNLAQTMERTHSLVLGIPSALGKTEAEVDALFIAAAALDV